MRTLATVGYEIDFDKAGNGIIPVGKGADWDGVLEEGTGFGGTQAMGMMPLALCS